MTHTTASAIARSTNVQTALSLLLTAIRHEAKQNGVTTGAICSAIDNEPLSAEIEKLIEKRFTK